MTDGDREAKQQGRGDRNSADALFGNVPGNNS